MQSLSLAIIAMVPAMNRSIETLVLVPQFLAVFINVALQGFDLGVGVGVLDMGRQVAAVLVEDMDEHPGGLMVFRHEEGIVVADVEGDLMGCTRSNPADRARKGAADRAVDMPGEDTAHSIILGQQVLEHLAARVADGIHPPDAGLEGRVVQEHEDVGRGVFDMGAQPGAALFIDMAVMLARDCTVEEDQAGLTLIVDEPVLGRLGGAPQVGQGSLQGIGIIMIARDDKQRRLEIRDNTAEDFILCGTAPIGQISGAHDTVRLRRHGVDLRNGLAQALIGVDSPVHQPVFFHDMSVGYLNN